MEALRLQYKIYGADCRSSVRKKNSRSDEDPRWNTRYWYGNWERMNGIRYMKRIKRANISSVLPSSAISCNWWCSFTTPFIQHPTIPRCVTLCRIAFCNKIPRYPLNSTQNKLSRLHFTLQNVWIRYLVVNDSMPFRIFYRISSHWCVPFDNECVCVCVAFTVCLMECSTNRRAITTTFVHTEYILMDFHFQWTLSLCLVAYTF